MKTVLLVTIAVFAVACDGSPQVGTSTDATRAESPATHTSAAPAATASNTTVTLVGCLQVPSLSGATGTTAGDRASASSTRIDATETKRVGAPIGRFVLTNAAVAPGATDANGAGASSGRVVTTGSSFELDGLPADAAASVNKRVRVTGRLDPRGVTAAPGNTGEFGPRDDVRANTTRAAGDATNNRLTVVTMQVVEQRCGPV